MVVYEIEQAMELFEELVDRAEAGEIIGIARNGKLVACLVPPQPEAS